MMPNCRSKVFVAAAAALLACGTANAAEKADSANTLTHGMVQMTLKVGQTTQLDVAEAFGAPNITTIDGQSQEVWIYDRHATVTASKESGFSIGMLVGGGGGGAAGGGWSWLRKLQEQIEPVQPHDDSDHQVQQRQDRVRLQEPHELVLIQ